MSDTVIVTAITSVGVIVAAILGYIGVQRTTRQAEVADRRDAAVEEDKTQAERDRVQIEGFKELFEQYRKDRAEDRREVAELRARVEHVEQELAATKRVNAQLTYDLEAAHTVRGQLVHYIKRLIEFTTNHGLTPPDPVVKLPLDDPPT